MLLQLKKSLRFDDAAEAKKNKMLLNSVRNIITIIWQTKTLAFLKLKAGNKKKSSKISFIKQHQPQSCGLYPPK